MKGIAILLSLCLILLAGGVWQKHQRGLSEKNLADAQLALRQTGDILAEIRALRTDIDNIEVGLKMLDETRNTTGEKRRETIKTSLVGESCADISVPDAIADSLQKRAAEVRDANYSGAFTPKSDSKH
jgi:hypothetical protein